MEQQIIFKMNISGVVNLYHGVNGILTCDHITCGPYIGLGGFKIRIISCSCIYCINSMHLTWDSYIVLKYQSRYYSVTKCKYYPILGKHNDLLIMDFIYKVI